MRAFTPTNNLVRLPEQSPLPGIVLMLSVMVVALVAVVLNSDLTSSLPYVYLLPWLLALTLVFAAPMLYLHRTGRFRFYDPIVFAVGSYLFPAFVIGGLMLVTGWSQPGFLNMIQDPRLNLPFTVVLVMIGFAGLAAGYLCPIGKVLGRSCERFLPQWDFAPEQYIGPGIVLLIVGLANVILALAMGVIGYQKPEDISAFDGLVFMTSSLWNQACFLLMFTLFRRRKYDLLFLAISVPLFFASVLKALFAGNRGSLLYIAITYGLAYLLTGAKVNFRRGMIAIVVLTVAMLAGMIYGTTFRNIKGGETQASMDRYAENISSTIENVGSNDFFTTLEFGFESLALRLDTLSSVAVVISNYEQLVPYEESYGLDNNIWRDLSTFLIPRVIWRDKPNESDPRRYSDLYFNNAESSFVITPFGDLVRNFGPIGVPIGMFIFGIILRVVYRALIEEQRPMTWRIVLYFGILTAVSYEAFYSMLIPNMTKFGITAGVGIVVVYLAARFMGYSKLSRRSALAGAQ